MSQDRIEHYSGVLVVTRPGRLDECARAIERRAGATVSVRDRDGDRMIVVLEAPTRNDLEQLHESLLSLPGVVTVDPVVHYVDRNPEGPVPAH